MRGWVLVVGLGFLAGVLAGYGVLLLLFEVVRRGITIPLDLVLVAWVLPVVLVVVVWRLLRRVEDRALKRSVLMLVFVLGVAAGFAGSFQLLCS